MDKIYCKVARIKWELIKYEIRRFTMSYCSQKKMDNRLQESNNLKKLEDLENCLGNHPCDDMILQIEQLRVEIRLMEQERIKGAIIRSKIRWAEEGEKSSKFFFDLEKHNYIKKQIRKLKINNGTTVTDQQSIEKETESFYSNLYKSFIDVKKPNDN